MTRAAATPGDVVYRTCPLCEAKCGIAVEVERSSGRVRDDPRRRRGPLQPRLPLPQGLRPEGPAGGSGPPAQTPAPRRARAGEEIGLGGGARVRGRRPARRARGARRRRDRELRRQPERPRPRLRALPAGAAAIARHQATLFGVERRPAAEDGGSCAAMFGAPFTIPVPDLDRTQLPARARRESARLERQPDDGPGRRPGACAGSASAAESWSSSTRAAARRRRSPTSTSSSCPAATPSSCSRSCTCSSKRVSRRPAVSRPRCAGSRRVRDAREGFLARGGGEGHRDRGSGHAPDRARVRRAPSAPPATGGSAPARRSSGRSRAGSSTS